MELKGQDKEMRMPLPSSFIYKNNINKVSYSPAPISSSVGPRRDQTVHGDPNPHQTLAEDHPRHQILNPTRDPDPDPVSASTDTRSPPQRPPTSHPQQVAAPTPGTINFTPLIIYRECLKNHAASMGGHVVDGCGEFMPSGDEGSPEALKCAACECHRSFHRKETNGESQYAPYDPNARNTGRRRFDPQQRTTLHHQRNITMPIAPPMINFGGNGLVESSNEDPNTFQFNGGGQPSQNPRSKKRFRTKFNQEQKDEMMRFAEKLGWRIQKEDEQLQQFCDQVGVKRRVFKVWMHNNKQAMKRKEM